MGSEWKSTTLGEVIELKRGYDLPKRLRVQGEVPLISSAGVSDFHSESKVTGPGVVTGRYGTIGEVFFSQQDFWPLNTTLYVRNFKGNDPKFVYYFLKTLNFEEFSDKAAVPGVNRNHVHMAEVTVPTCVSEQKAIAHILGTLDAKIELNRRMNATLEGMAQALFKSWFVDFDPVIDNALAAGNPIPEELAPRAEVRQKALASSGEPSRTNSTTQQGSVDHPTLSDPKSLFPAAFQFTEELGWIPEGWAAKPFGGILAGTIGGDWGKEAEDEKHTRSAVIIRGTDMPHIQAGNRSSAPERWVEPKKFATRELQDSDIVIEISGGSSTQSTGRSLYITDSIMKRLGGSVVPASFCRRFRPIDRYHGLYGALHLALIYRQGKMWEYQNQSTGISNFQTTSFLEREFVAYPSNTEILEELYRRVRPLAEKTTSNQQELLAKLRDTLLPKLISGELRISEAEQLSEMAQA